MKLFQVFMVTNLINNKVYFSVTSAKTLNDRISVIISASLSKPKKMKLKDGYMGKTPLQKAIMKYGKHNFQFHMLYSKISKEKAYRLKEKYIKEHDAMNPEYGYNCTTGGSDSYKNAPHVIERQTEAQTGKKMPDSYVEITKARIGKLHPAFGFKHSKEARERMRQGQLNSDYVQSEESKKRTGETMKKRWQEPEIIAKMANRKRGVVTEETRRKLRKTSGGKNNGMYGRKGKLSPQYGMHRTEEEKQNISKKNKENARKRKMVLIEKYKNRTEKKCKHCGIIKPLDRFYRAKRTLDGYIGHCIPCERVRANKKRRAKKSNG